MCDQTHTVSIDPNSVYRFDPSLSVAEIGDASGKVIPGDVVTVVQTGSGNDPDFFGTGRVAKVNHEYGLLYIDVNWGSFQDAVPVHHFAEYTNESLELAEEQLPAAEEAFNQNHTI